MAALRFCFGVKRSLVERFVPRYRLVGAASNRVESGLRNAERLHLRSRRRDYGGCGVLQRALADVSLRHRRLRVGRCQAAPVEQYRNLVAGSKLTVGAAPLVDEA